MTPREEKVEIARRALRREQEILAYAKEHEVDYGAALNAVLAENPGLADAYQLKGKGGK